MPATCNDSRVPVSHTALHCHFNNGVANHHHCHFILSQIAINVIRAVIIPFVGKCFYERDFIVPRYHNLNVFNTLVLQQLRHLRSPDVFISTDFKTKSENNILKALKLYINKKTLIKDGASTLYNVKNRYKVGFLRVFTIHYKRLIHIFNRENACVSTVQTWRKAYL